MSWYNDSKATNPAAARGALSAFPGAPVSLIAGGYGGGFDLRQWVADVLANTEAVILIGSPLTLGIAFGLFRFRSWSPKERLLLLSYLLYFPVYLFPSLGGSHVRYLAPVLPIAAIFAGPQFTWLVREAKKRTRLWSSALIVGLTSIVGVILAVVDVKPPYLVQYVGVFFAFSALVIALVLLPELVHSPMAKRLGVVALAIGLLAPGVFAVVAERYPPREASLDVALIHPDRATFLEARFGDDYRMWTWINMNLPSDAVLLTFEARLFYLERRVIFGSSHEMLPTYSENLDEAVAFIRALGVDFILDSPWSHIPEVNRIFISRSVLFQSLGYQSRFHVVHAEGQVILYDLV